MLGTVEAFSGGRPVPIGQRLERCLLGILVVHLNTVVQTERLVGLLWGGAAPARPRAALQVHVSRLRKAGFEIGTRHGGYIVEGDPQLVDLHRFQSIGAQARGLAGDGERAAGFRRALAEWGGPPLDGALTDDVRDRLVAPIVEAYHSTWDLCFAAEVAAGQHTAILPELAAQRAERPFDERLAELHMRALHGSGQRVAALDAYRAFRELSLGELGLEPGTQIQALHQAILRGDVQQPEPAMPVPAQLPASIPDFTGRAGLLASLDALVPETNAVVITTLAGGGGVGKTALAVHWGQQARHHFPDGQLYVNLNGYSAGSPSEPAAVLGRFLRALGVQPSQVPHDAEEAAALYRTLLAGKRVLVLLDNAQHAGQIRPLLPPGAGSLALITSRDKLAGLVARDGARRLAVGALPPAEAAALLSQIIGQVRAAAEPEAVTELAGLCGGLPLALRITAAQLAEQPGMTVAGHVRRLRDGDRLAALDLDEDLSVRVTFEHSYAVLKPEAARLFRLLGLLPGPDFSARAAAALTGQAGARADAETSRLLGLLVTAHLLERRDSGRYAFHDLIRLYASALAETDPEREAAIGRYYEWYVRSADAAAWLLSPDRFALSVPDSFRREGQVEHADHVEALAWCDAEADSFLAAAVSPPPGTDPQYIWLLVESVRFYFLYRRLLAAGLTLSEAGLAAAQHTDDPQVRAAMHYSVSVKYQLQYRFAEAEPHFLAALEWISRTQLTTAKAIYLKAHGISLYLQGRLAEAAESQSQAIPLFAMNAEDRDGVAVTESVLAFTYTFLGRYAEAIPLAEHSIRVISELRPQLLPSHAAMLAQIHMEAGRSGEGMAWLARGLAAAEQFENSTAATVAMVSMAACHVRDGRPEEARRVLEGILAQEARSRSLVTDSEARTALAKALFALGQPEQAVAQAEEAVQVTIHNPVFQCVARAALAGILLGTGDRERAAEQARLAVEHQRVTGHRIGLAQSLVVLGEATGDQSCVEEARAICAEIGVPFSTARWALPGAVQTE